MQKQISPTFLNSCRLLNFYIIFYFKYTKLEDNILMYCTSNFPISTNIFCFMFSRIELIKYQKIIKINLY